MKEVGAFEAKTHLSQLLERVARGERFTITRHGQPVAVLSPVSAPQRRSLPEAVAQIRDFQGNHRLGNISLRRLIEEGRK